MWLHFFRQKRRNLHVFRLLSRSKTLVFSVFSRLWHQNKFNAVISPNPWKRRYLHCFLQFFHVPMPLANSNIYTKNRSKTLFLSVWLHFFRQKRRNLHVFRLLSRSKTLVFAVFSMLWHPKTIQHIAIYSVFSFLSVFPLPEADQNDPKFRFNTLLSSDTQKSSKKHANTTNTRSRCEIVFAPPQLKLI